MRRSRSPALKGFRRNDGSRIRFAPNILQIPPLNIGAAAIKDLVFDEAAEVGRRTSQAGHAFVDA